MGIFENVSFGPCIWDIPAFLLLVGMVAVCLTHIRRQKKREEKFEEELAAKIAKRERRKRKDHEKGI